jgi:hypothetical protein
MKETAEGVGTMEAKGRKYLFVVSMARTRALDE